VRGYEIMYDAKFVRTTVLNPLILAFSLREKGFKPLSQCHSDRVLLLEESSTLC
jgi:hypothetical protein